jgi:NCS1 nucleoside transporter family
VSAAHLFMTSVATKKPSTGFEVTGIERVEETDRAHTQLWDTMWLWWSANSVVATVATGSIAAFSGLGVLGSIIVIIVFTLLGVLPVAFLSTLGPKTGLAQMPLSRFSFGLQGAKLPAVFNALACIGWSAVNATIGSTLIVSWSAGKIPQWAALGFLAVITTLVSVFGYFIVHRYERFAWIPMFILFGYVLVTSARHFNLNVPASVTGLALFGSVALFGGAIFGYAVGWSSYAADYTRRQPVDTPSGRVFLYALLGVAIPCIALEVLGALLAMSLVSNFNLVGAGAGPLMAANIAGSPIAGLVLLLLAFSTIANNVPNDYSFALSAQVLGINIRRWILTIIGAVAYVAVAYYFFARNFSSNLEGFLLLIAYWLGAWNAIVLIEHWLRKGKYPVEDYATASRLPPGIAAVVSMVAGLVVAALGVNQFATIHYEGPLARALDVNNTPGTGADLGFPLAILVTAVLYFILRRWELARYKR